MKIEFTFPYTPENFTKAQKEILSRFFTNVDKPVFAIFGLPQEIVGAMFSRYSRTSKSIRRVFLDEFWGVGELGIKKLGEARSQKEFQRAYERTKDFYQRVFAEYGDDSVIQMGSVHVALEFVSQIAAKAIEDNRVASAYIEKSTRYVDFSGKVNGRYLFMDVSEIVSSKFRTEYFDWNNALFNAYVKHLPFTIEYFRSKYPLKKQVFTNPEAQREIYFSDIKKDEEKDIAQKAYERALKAKALDTIRVFLPTTTVTNLGAHFSGHAAETALNKMISSPYTEVKILGKMALGELIKIAPNFLQHIGHEYGERKREYLSEIRFHQESLTERILKGINATSSKESVKLVDWDKDTDLKILSQVLYTAQKYKRLSKKDIKKYLKSLPRRKVQKLLLASMPDRSKEGLNRRHKLPRAFEHADCEVEFNCDFGIYRDLQRNRISSTERQALNASEISVSEDFQSKGMKKVLKDYLALSQKTNKFQEELLKDNRKRFEYAAEYITMLGHKLRFNIRASIRQWVFFAELRTIEGGHPTYRHAIQEAVRQIVAKMPYLKRLFAHVNWKRDYGLGRLKAEVRTQVRLREAKK